MRLTTRQLRSIIREASSFAEPDVFRNDLDPSMTVVVVYPGDPRYAQLAPVFAQKGHAFLAREDVMVVDGEALSEPWFSEDHLTVIQAHELGHKLAGHIGMSAHDDVKLEREADWLGYKILRHRGLTDAADLHEDEYEARYRSLPDKDDYLMLHLVDYIT
jgi:hypothetical protein